MEIVKSMIDTVLHGDALAVLKTLEDNSVDAIVTDPPAGISFMGKIWDSFEGQPKKSQKPSPAQERWSNNPPVRGRGERMVDMNKGRDAFIAFLTAVMQEALRVLKPGGHALVWALPRTSHWTATALEDAGFEVRDAIFHHFGSGFPKSHNLGNGLGTALKPSTEIWWLCRKPLSEPSIAANVLAWGTGGLNIDGCRVANTGKDTTSRPNSAGKHYEEGEHVYGKGLGYGVPMLNTQGRWPSHLLLSHSLWCQPQGVKRVRNTSGEANGKERANTGSMLDGMKYHGTTYYGKYEEVEAYDCAPGCPIRLLDDQSGIRKSGGGIKSKAGHSIGLLRGEDAYHFRHDGEYCEPSEGGASRYFTNFPPDDYTPYLYQSKASRAERNLGLAHMQEQASSRYGKMNGTPEHGAKHDTPEQNTHPTVKSTSLMRWLIRLITPPDGIVLDMFGGSGSTAVAAIQEGKHFILIEQDSSYVAICEARIAHAWQEQGIFAEVAV